MKRLEIGLAADRSIATIFEPLIAALARATDALNKFEAKAKTSVKAVADTSASEANKMAAQAAKAFAQMEAASAKASAKEIADADKVAQAKIKADLKAFDQKLKHIERQNEAAKKAADAEEREIMRTVAAAEKAEQRKFVAQQKRDKSERESRSVGIGREAMSTFAGVARKGMAVGGEILGGAGVSFDLSSAVSRGISFQSTATKATMSAASAEGRIASASDVKDTMGVVRSAGDATGLDYNKLAQGVETFVSKSSDIVTVKAALADLGKTAQATGSDISDFTSLAGEVNRSLRDMPAADKPAALLSVMRLFAAQGAKGNVEVKQLGQYGGRLVASAGSFEGTLDERIGRQGALAQMAMEGGKVTAAEATNSALAFERDMKSPEQLKRLEQAGINVWANKEKTKLKSQNTIVGDVLDYTGGDLSKLSSLMRNETSRAPVQAFSALYTKAGGGAAGRAAVESKFADYGTTISAKEVEAHSKLAMDTPEARAQKFQNSLDTIASSLAERVLPAMEKLAPKVIEVVDALAKMVGMAAENPGKAIVLAIVASIAKAQIGASIAGAMPGLLSGAGGMIGAAGAAGGAMGLAGKAGLVGLAGAAGAALGTLMAPFIFDPIADRKDKGVNQSVEDEARRGNLLGKAAYESRRGGVSQETLAELETMRTELEGRIAKAADPTSTLGAMFSTDKTIAGASKEQQDAAKIGDLKADLAALLAATRENKPPKNVTVDNMPGGPGPLAGEGTSNTGAPVLTGKR